jgi:hypothetical protein
MTLEEALVAVWRGALAEGAAQVDVDGQKFPVRETPRKHLREVDFVLKASRCAGWNRIRRRLLAGRNWHGRDTK